MASQIVDTFVNSGLAMSAIAATRFAMESSLAPLDAERSCNPFPSLGPSLEEPLPEAANSSHNIGRFRASSVSALPRHRYGDRERALFLGRLLPRDDRDCAVGLARLNCKQVTEDRRASRELEDDRDLAFDSLGDRPRGEIRRGDCSRSVLVERDRFREEDRPRKVPWSADPPVTDSGSLGSAFSQVVDAISSSIVANPKTTFRASTGNA